MPTAWEVKNKSIPSSGPTWDSLNTEGTDDYDALGLNYWNWARDWTLGGKIGASSPSWTVRDRHVSNHSQQLFDLWSDESTVWLSMFSTFGYETITWDIITNTKTITGTES